MRPWRASSSSASGSRRRRATEIAEDELGRIVKSRNVTAALLEAAIAALFLEHGYEKIEGAIVAAFADRIEYARTTHVDHKTALQEALAKSSRQVSYSVLEVEGPPHDRKFLCAAHDRRGGARPRHRPLEEGRRAGRGQGGARSSADEQLAA